MRCKRERRAELRTPPPTLAEKLWARIRREPSGCWRWTGAPDGRGYGVFNRRPAHKLIYELLVGPVPVGFVLDHICHNEDESCPGGTDCLHRSCVNPSHLVVATIAENVMRGKGFAPLNAAKTECPVGHAYDAANTYINGSGHRLCRACNRDRQRVLNRSSLA